MKKTELTLKFGSVILLLFFLISGFIEGYFKLSFQIENQIIMPLNGISGSLLIITFYTYLIFTDINRQKIFCLKWLDYFSLFLSLCFFIYAIIFSGTWILYTSYFILFAFFNLIVSSLINKILL